MTAWALRPILDGVAKAGKAGLDVPMYINVWLVESDL